jgi:hypothetical protein
MVAAAGVDCSSDAPRWPWPSAYEAAEAPCSSATLSYDRSSLCSCFGSPPTSARPWIDRSAKEATDHPAARSASPAAPTSSADRRNLPLSSSVDHCTAVLIVLMSSPPRQFVVILRSLPAPWKLIVLLRARRAPP